MQPFDHPFRTRIVFGPDTLPELGKLAAEFHAPRVMLVCDPGISATDHFVRAKQSLEASGLVVQHFGDFDQNPDSDMIQRATIAAAEFRPDLLVGLGGGSSLDCCKGMNFVYSCGGKIHDYHGVGKATCDLLPMIAVPTTAGTGSEMQSFAIISDSQTHMKMPCGDPRAAPAIAILDPMLTLTCPAAVTALTGVDAISHAIESYVTRRRTPISQTFSRRAFGLLGPAFGRVLDDPDDTEARGSMLLGAALAGMAIETSMLGGAHATANPLTAHHAIIHGQAVGLMLPAVIRMNGSDCGPAYQELLREIGITATVDQASDRLAAEVTRWVRQAGLATSFAELGLSSEQIPILVEGALQQWTGTFNPVPLDAGKVQDLYASVLG